VVAFGQPAAATPPSPIQVQTEWIIAAGFAKSVNLFDSTSGRTAPNLNPANTDDIIGTIELASRDEAPRRRTPLRTR